jgi:hypothetical protein
MVRIMERFLGSYSVAVSGQPYMEVTVCFGVRRKEAVIAEGGQDRYNTSVPKSML